MGILIVAKYSHGISVCSILLGASVALVQLARPTIPSYETVAAVNDQKSANIGSFCGSLPA
jgi:hypothetical protein